MKFRPFLLSLLLSLSVAASAQSLSDILKALQQQGKKADKPDIPVLVQPNPQQSEAEFLKNAYDATFLLYRQDESGDMAASCTATSITKSQGGYALLTASHCVNEDFIYYVTRDEQNPKVFYKVDAAICGKESKGMDFCLLHVTTKDEFAVVPLGVDPAGIGGEPVAAVTSPLGLGKQVFRGSIATPHVKRPILLKGKDNDDKGNWYGYILFQMPGINPASSGSALLCMNQRAICGVIVGVMSTPIGAEQVASPIKSVVDEIQEAGIARQAKDGPDEPTPTGVPKK